MPADFDRISNDDLIDLLLRPAPVLEIGRRFESLPEEPDLHVAPQPHLVQHIVVGHANEPLNATPEAKSQDGWSYRPLDSVWYGEDDSELIEGLLQFYPHREPQLILDATVNGGRFWRGTTRPVVGLDIDPRHCPDVCADNASLPFRSGQFDVVVYDPPHIPNQGRDRSKDFNTRFGLGARSAKEYGYTFAHTYPAFMREAWRVLIEDGVLLCKIADYVHNHRYQWAHVDLIRSGQDVGFTACDCIIKVRKAPIIDPKWKTAHHSRRQHSYWIVFRKSARCE